MAMKRQTKAPRKWKKKSNRTEKRQSLYCKIYRKRAGIYKQEIE